MIVAFPTAKLAAAAAAATGGVQIEITRKIAGVETPAPSRYLDLGDIDLEEFEQYRDRIEAHTISYTLRSGLDPDAIEYPNGWRMRGAKFEVTTTKPEQIDAISSHFGARRYAYNWVVGTIKDNLDARKTDPDSVASVPWNFYDLRKRWNASKDEVAPWWAQNSKESYAAGISDAVTALQNWSASKRGARKGRRVGFPDFKARHKDAERVRFTTGAMRLDPDRRTIVLPTIGALRSKENTRRIQRPVAAGRARIFSMTLTRRWGRLFVSISYAERTPTTPVHPTKPAARAGVDLGLRNLATVVDTDGTVTEFPNPAPLRQTLAERRRLGRALSRRIPGSRGYLEAKAKLQTLDRRTVHLREQAMHQLTGWLARTYGEVVIEDLDIAAMKKSMGRRAFRRSVSDAGLGRFRPMLEHKAEATGCRVTVADRWFPSTAVHHGCGCRLLKKHHLDKTLHCAVTGAPVDRDINAGHRLRDYSTTGPVGTGILEAPTPEGKGSGARQLGRRLEPAF